MDVVGHPDGHGRGIDDRGRVHRRSLSCTRDITALDVGHVRTFTEHVGHTCNASPAQRP